MSALFSSPKIPKPPPPPPPPQTDLAASEAAAKERARLKSRRGTAATILNAGGASGMSDAAPGAQRQLLGSNSLLGGQPSGY